MTFNRCFETETLFVIGSSFIFQYSIQHFIFRNFIHIFVYVRFHQGLFNNSLCYPWYFSFSLSVFLLRCLTRIRNSPCGVYEITRTIPIFVFFNNIQSVIALIQQVLHWLIISVKTRYEKIFPRRLPLGRLLLKPLTVNITAMKNKSVVRNPL